MKTASGGNKLERYPELLFLVSYTSFQPYSFPLHREDIDQEIKDFLQKINLDGVDILYVYGIGKGYHYAALKNWLKERRERRLIFIEDELSVISELVQSEHGESLLYDPQVLIHFISNPLEELAAAFPCDRVEVAAIESYQKKKKNRFGQVRLKLLRLCSVSHALLTESLYSHKLLGNLLKNIKRWHGSFYAGGLKGKFRNIPAMICGAGPSLSKSIEELKMLEDRALIIAGGSTIAALSNQGIHPHIGIALDPNEEEFSRLKVASAYETPLIYATRLQPDVFNAVSGERGYLVSDTGGSCERFFEKEMGIDSEPIGPELGAEAMSVTTLAIALAVEMGCNPILLNGIDLAYTGMKRYADGVMPSSTVQIKEIAKQTKAPERLLKRKSIEGHYVHTLVKWVMESDCIASFAKAHPECRFINVSAGGIGFDGIPNVPLSEVDLEHSSDLRALVHAEIQALKMPPLKEKIYRKMQEIKESLLRLGSFAEEMLDELHRVKDSGPFPTGKMTILEIDFQEEIAFECLFPHLGPALDKLLARAYYISPDSPSKEQRRMQVESKIAKWKQFKEVIFTEITVFTRVLELT